MYKFYRFIAVVLLVLYGCYLFLGECTLVPYSEYEWEKTSDRDNESDDCYTYRLTPNNKFMSDDNYTYSLTPDGKHVSGYD